MVNRTSSLPKSWVSGKLGEICYVVEKVQPRNKPEKSFAYIQISSIDNTRQKIIKPLIYFGKDAPSRARQLIRSGDILFSTVRTYLRNVAFVDEEYDGQIASTGFCVIRPSKPMSSKFVFYVVQTDRFLNKLTQIQRGTSYPAVRNPDVFAQVIPIPPTCEQLRIVSKIEEVVTKLNAGVESLGSVKVQLRRYRQSVLKHAFEGKLTEEWRKTKKHGTEPASKLLKRIREERKSKARKYKEPLPMDTSNLTELPKGWLWTNFGSLLFDARYGTSKKCYAVPHGIPVLRIPNVVNGSLNFDNLKYTELEEEKLAKLTLEVGDILIVRTNGSLNLVGRASVINKLPEKCVFASYLIRLRPVSKDTMPKYLGRVLSSQVGRTTIQKKARTTAGQYNVNLKTLRSIPVPLPPYNEMLHIVDKIDSLFSIADEIGKNVEISLMQSEQLRQSVLKTAFEGRLVPQDPTDEPAEKLLEHIRKNREKLRSEEKRKKRTKSTRKERRKQLELVRYVK